MAKGPAKAVLALIAAARQRQSDRAAIQYLKDTGQYVGNRPIRARRSDQGGTRGGQREDTR